jgi:hypothetical protein
MAETIENIIKPKLLRLMKNWNKRVVYQHACNHYTNKRENELRYGELEWIKSLFEIFPDMGLTEYYAVATCYMIDVKKDFLNKENGLQKKLQEWYEEYFYWILDNEVIPEIKKHYNNIKTNKNV